MFCYTTVQIGAQLLYCHKVPKVGFMTWLQPHHELQILRRTAYQLYCEQDNEQAAQVYKRALKLAETINSPNDVVFFRLWHAIALSGAEQYMEALAILTPTLRSLGQEGRPQDVYTTVTLYVDVALDIPLDYCTVLEPLAFCEEYLETVGRREWRHKLCYLWARLYERRGQFQDALRVAEEGWSIWQSRHPAYTADTHLEHIVGYCLRTRQPELAAHYLEVWANDRHNDMPLYRHYKRSGWLANYHRFVGDLETAEAYAHECLTHAEKIGKDDQARGLLARILMTRGKLEATRGVLCCVTATLHQKKTLTLGDYHLASARDAAGMAPVDDIYGQDFPPPTQIADPRRARHELRRARAMYRCSLPEAIKWDTAFDCHWRQDDIAARQERLAAIEALL